MSSEIKGDLLVLFHKNPGLIDSLDGIARRIGRTSNLVDGDLNDLVSIGLITEKNLGKFHIYQLNRQRDKEIQELTAQHLRETMVGI